MKLYFWLIVGATILMSVATLTASAQEKVTVNRQARVAVTFERFSGSQEIVARAFRQALREAGFEVVFTGRNKTRMSGSERDFEQLGNVDYVLVINGSENTRTTSGSVNLNLGSFRGSTRPRGQSVYISGELVDATTRTVVRSGEAEGEASDSGLSFNIGRRRSLGYRSDSRENLRFAAALEAAKKLVSQLK